MDWGQRVSSSRLRQHTRLEIAVLKRTRRVSSWIERSMLWTPVDVVWITENGVIEILYLQNREQRSDFLWLESQTSKRLQWSALLIQQTMYQRGDSAWNFSQQIALPSTTRPEQATERGSINLRGSHMGDLYLIRHVWLEYGLVPPKGYRIDNSIDVCTKQWLFDLNRVYTIFQWNEPIVSGKCKVDRNEAEKVDDPFSNLENGHIFPFCTRGKVGYEAIKCHCRDL